MEKEKEGLFGRLVHFWKEKIRMQGEDGIGFWKVADDVENHFAEMGAVTVLSQKETRGTFWQEEAERKVQEKKVIQLLPEAEMVKVRKEISEEAEEREEKAEQGKRIFMAERFLEGKTERADGSDLRPVFMRNMPEEDGKKRDIIPVLEKNSVMQEREQISDVMQEGKTVEDVQKEEKSVEQRVDVEQLMREITKRLREEREGCGRRLR